MLIVLSIDITVQLSKIATTQEIKKNCCPWLLQLSLFFSFDVHLFVCVAYKNRNTTSSNKIPCKGFISRKENIQSRVMQLLAEKKAMFVVFDEKATGTSVGCVTSCNFIMVYLDDEKHDRLRAKSVLPVFTLFFVQSKRSAKNNITFTTSKSATRIQNQKRWNFLLLISKTYPFRFYLRLIPLWWCFFSVFHHFYDATLCHFEIN